MQSFIFKEILPQFGPLGKLEYNSTFKPRPLCQCGGHRERGKGYGTSPLDSFWQNLLVKETWAFNFNRDV